MALDVNALRGALMVCGTTSDAGKSVVVAGLCRLLARRGVRVAPFKAQNMALNSAVTRSGHEIGRAQYLQAQAAGIEPEVAFNPVLLKPTGERSSQVVVNGRPIGTMSAVEYHRHKAELLGMVLDTLAGLRARFDVVLVEGAGSPAEINLLDHDIVNLRLAHEAAIAAIVVGDIDRGGVFAALHGTVDLLPAHLRACVRGFVINKFRGDPALLFDATAQLERACGVPTLGVLPMLAGLDLDAEDSLFVEAGGWSQGGRGANPDVLDGTIPDGMVPVGTVPGGMIPGGTVPVGTVPAGPVLDVAVAALPHLSNFTDLDPLAAEPAVSVRLVHHAAQLGRPHLVVLAGSKHTVADLGWLHRTGLAAGVTRLVGERATSVLGICGGYQMLGRSIHDDVESGAGTVAGLGLLDVETRFASSKVLRRSHGEALGCPLEGYQIHQGRVRPTPERDDPARRGAPGSASEPTDADWLTFDGRPDGRRRGPVLGTTVHGLFEQDRFRQAFLAEVAGRAGIPWSPSAVRFAARRERGLDRMADAIEAHCDLGRLVALLSTVPATVAPRGA